MERIQLTIKTNKKTMITFNQIIQQAPQIIKDKLNDLHSFKENPKWHPEPNAFEHTKIVTNRCLSMFPNDANMALAGVLHDICKFDCAGIHEKTGQPTSYGHDKAAADLIATNKDVQSFIKSFGADVNIVHDLVADHMRMHTFANMKDVKQQDMMAKRTFVKQAIFATFDNMLISDDVALALANNLYIHSKFVNYKSWN